MYFWILLGMLEATWAPTPCYRDAYLVDTPKWAYWGKGWQKHCKTTFSPFCGRFFLVSKRTIFGVLLYGCFKFGGPSILGLASGLFPQVNFLLNLLMWVVG